MSASEIYSPAEEEAAFGQVYREHHQKLLRYCQYRLRDRHEAEDVMQESFVRAWRTMPPHAYGSNFYPWLRVVAGNLCTDVLRKRSRSEPMADIEPGAVDGGMDRITDEEDRELVRRALLRLNDRHRDALMMRESEGLTYDQIAERTGVTSGTVESLLWRARQALKREFTVVSGRAGAFFPLPVLGAVAANVKAARRRLAAGLARRMPGFSRSLSDSPAGHLVLAAITTLTVVGGIAATFSVGGAQSGNRGALPMATPSLVSATEAPTVTAAAEAVLASATAQASSTTATTSAMPATPGASRVKAPSPSLSNMRVLNPISSGATAAQSARKAPVAVNFAGDIAVGASPTSVVKYVGHTTTEVANSADQALTAAPLGNTTPKENK